MIQVRFKISNLFTGVLLLAISTHSYAQYQCSNSYEWSPNGYFLANDVVHYKGVGYRAKWVTANQRPDQSGTFGSWENLGYCYATRTVNCDFNGDGKLDSAKGIATVHLIGPLIPSSNPAIPPVRENKDFLQTGEVSITYGNTAPDAAPDKIWNQNRLGMFPYARPHTQFGYQLASGDFNNDNFCDLAITAPGFSYKGLTLEKRNDGLINILYGSPNGLGIIVLGENGKPINPFDAQRFDQDSPNVPGMAEANDRFGEEMVTGDFNGDGFDDIAIGVPNESTVLPQQVEVEKAGFVNILFGSKRGIQTSNPKAVGYFQNISGSSAPEVEESDFFGDALAAADFDNDGYDDLAISASFEDVDALHDAKGQITLLRGSPSGLDPLSKKNFTLKDIIPELNPSYSFFGAKLSISDFNADGFPDLEVLSNYCNPAPSTNCYYKTFKIPGSASGLVINN